HLQPLFIYFISESFNSEYEFMLPLHYVFIIIEDNAGGVQKEIINKIFDMYFTTKHKRQGTGLGLYLTKIIIEKKFKGNINVQNGELGSKFLIKLPIFQTINN
uniref:ATP-binding protein n=1 Tax=Aliarcobacter sp. TaxID=2321116 RepID=UPI004048AFFD